MSANNLASGLARVATANLSNISGIAGRLQAVLSGGNASASGLANSVAKVAGLGVGNLGGSQAQNSLAGATTMAGKLQAALAQIGQMQLGTPTGGVKNLGTAAGGAAGVASGLLNQIKNITTQQIGLVGAPQTAAALSSAAAAGQSLLSRLLQMAGIDLGTVLSVGSFAGWVGIIGVATKRFMELGDEIKNTEIKFRLLGIESEVNTQKVFAFGRQAAESFGLAQGEARKLAVDLASRSLTPERWEETARGALGLSAALGITAQRAQMIVQQLEAGNTTILRRLHPSFARLIEQGAGRVSIEAAVNDMIARGAEISQERMGVARHPSGVFILGLSSWLWIAWRWHS